MWLWCAAAAVVVLAASGERALAQDRFARTDSRNQYVHRIQLYDASKKLIDPSDPNAPPYSPMATCGKCHDYKAIAHGWHFNALEKGAPAGRPGEPWIWTDRRTGTQIPLSYRGWDGTFQPGEVGMSRWDFITTFGRHYPGEAGPEETAPEGRWNLSGALAIDCMICHGDNRSYDPEAYAKQIAKHNFAWAPTAAIGLGYVSGDVSRLPEKFDPAKPPEEGKPSLPKVAYYQHKFNPDKEVFFDIVRRPSTNNCYYCHTARPVGPGTPADWNQDNDVHMKAGLSCVACHRNGIEHHTVRGFEGEKHPDGADVSTLSCRGCHIGEHDATSLAEFGGRLGSPRPHHGGIPPLHFESLSCTACHSGPLPDMSAGQMQTSLAHELGLPSQTREDGDQPIIIAPVYLRNEAGVIEPRRMVWPAYWARMSADGETVTPINPEAAYGVVRSSLRIRNDFMREVGEARLSAAEKAKLLGEERAKLRETELTQEEQLKLARATVEKAAGEFPEKITKALAAFAKDKKSGEGVPVYISAGKLYRLGDDGKLVITEGHAAAKPYSWPLGHDVRPARQALGAAECTDCHAADSPFVHGTVAAAGPAPDATPVTMKMAALQGLDEDLWQAWTLSFQGRDAFKIVAMVALALLTLVLVLYGLRALGGFGAWLNRPK